MHPSTVGRAIHCQITSNVPLFDVFGERISATAAIAGSQPQTVNFTINGVEHRVDNSIPSGTSLNVYIRNYANLRGTKSMCLEGGCGACMVSARVNGRVMAVNSCLVPILICEGWEITTVEGIGDHKSGYHPVQARLAQFNGSQCGYCSPGMVMNMYSLIQGERLTMTEIENSFGSNMCRCTGYRPILDAFKSFATDADPQLIHKVQDIEELSKIKVCPANPGKSCVESCEKKKKKTKPTRHLVLDDAEFYKVPTVEGLFSIFEKNPASSYVLNGGNTGHGVYRLQKPDIYVDVNGIPDLQTVHLTEDGLTLGANLTLTTAMRSLENFSKNNGFAYLKHLVRHIDLIASVPVRNIGTIAGNLMLKHQHREFPSDLFLILETAGARLHILQSPKNKVSVDLMEFLETDMRHKIIYSVVLPPLGAEYEYRSFKVMPRAQNAHAHVNAGFLLRFDGRGIITEKPNIIFGGIRRDFLHASKTEDFLKGKNLVDGAIFRKALKILDDELKPDHVLPDGTPEFRRILAEGLFYKFVLSIAKADDVDPKLRSGGTVLERGLSSGRQDFDTDKNKWPLNKPVQKIEGIRQTSGEARYVDDLHSMPGEVFCAFALTDVPNGFIEHIDTTEALRTKGVVAFYVASDVPGRNVFIPGDSKLFYINFDEPLFADKAVLYAGQPVGVIAATSHAIANEAASKVRIIYAGALDKKPVVTVEDAIASKDETRILNTVVIPAQARGTDVKHVIRGEFSCGSQYHYTMETQSCVCVPLEDGIDVFTSTQGVDLSQNAIAACLGIPVNSINVRVRRVGGGYGAKISRSAQVACACALVCRKLNRPARFAMTVESNMSAVGKRPQTRQEYEVGVDDAGKIQYLDSKHWSSAGSSFNEPTGAAAALHCGNCYDVTTWTREGNEARTDLPSNTYCRAPGAADGLASTENIMEHIARVIGRDPTEVRLANMDPADNGIAKELMEDLKSEADYDTRRGAVTAFNGENRWKKKGIAVMPMKYGFTFFGHFNASVSIYRGDGSVAITHGGIEIGQGINTKVVQVAAYTLGIDMDLISVKPTNNFTSPNDSLTGGSWTSDSCAYATMMACKELMARLEPIRRGMKNPTWTELIAAAYEKEVDLSARYMFRASSDDVKPYNVWGGSICEVEVDLLTGQHLVSRVDLMVDAGVSISPEVDVGQAEGAFVMGLGYWTSEDLVYDPDTAVLKNNRTWNYKPPGAKDIPADFRVWFRRNAPNPAGVLSSKATGEPPLCTSYAVLLAIRNALDSARSDAGNTDKWFNLHAPATTEKILLNGLTSREHMII
ncbi:indole-3-acetaldehyde oxidase-like isoform X3 [Athalia rosae]|uniref:indole-3-acetaldehyde oxidase-like isoform X3 n=1 Tax=Athalia rosae TaxID=37344 RepID=UPI0020336C5F|nr:indole-3-acetaldehyde oxidase-like isoform X3 [Athalia rosae]